MNCNNIPGHHCIPPFNPGRTALLHPQPDGIYRLDYQLPPDEDLIAAKEPISLLDCFGHSFVVLYFCTDADAGLSALREVATDLPDIPVALYLVVPKPPTTPATDAVCVLLDREGKGASAYNAGPRTLYLVRPDRHIAARRFESDSGELLMLLRYAVGVEVK